MLQSIRDKIQGWIAGVIIAVLGLGFVLWGVQYYIESGTGAKQTVAKVDGVKISEKELNNLFQQIQRQQQAKAKAPFSETMNQELKQYALQQLIAGTALLQAANKAGFRVGLGQVKQLVASEPVFQENGQFSAQRFQQLLYANNETPREFFKNIQSTLITNQFMLGLQGSAFVLPSEQQKAYELLKQSRSLRYLVIPKANFVKKVTVTSQDIAKYYQQNKDVFKLPMKVQVSYILLSPKKISNAIQVKPAEVKQFYDTNRQSFATPQRWKVSRIIVPLAQNATPAQIKAAQKQADQWMKELKKGTSFSALVKANQQAKTLSGWISGGKASAALAQMLNTMKVNQVSVPFRTPAGMTIVQLLEHQAAKPKPFAQVKARIEKSLRQQKIQKILTSKSNTLSNLTYTNPTTLKPAAKALNVPLQTSAMISRKGEKTGIFSNPNVLGVVFSKDVLKQGNNSNIVTLKNGSAMVLRISKKIASKERPLLSVRDQIKTKIVAQRSQGMAGLQAYQIQTAIAKGKSMQSIAAKDGYKLVSKTNVTQLDKDIPEPIVTTAFALSASQAGKTAVNSVQLKNGDFAVVRLVKVRLADYQKTTAQDRKRLGQNLSHYWGQMDYKLYVQGTMKNAKININQKALQGQ